MLVATLRSQRAWRAIARAGAVTSIAAVAWLWSGTAFAQPLALALSGSSTFHHEALRGTVIEPQAEVKRRHARAKKVRSTRATRLSRARAARINRLLRGYRAARLARARVPLTRRVSYARRELAQAERRGAKYCLATAIYHEARYESVRGQRAVAEVILARTRVPSRPKSVCGVVYEGAWRTTGCQFSFTCDNRSDAAANSERWEVANKIAGQALVARGKSKHIARNATFYHANYVRPRWSKRMVRIARIGTHIFYRPRKGRGAVGGGFRSSDRGSRSPFAAGR